jgi:hypothetical protein
MARVHEETITITISRLVKNDGGEPTPIVDGELLIGVETLVQELVGTDAVVEITSIIA